jgi:hypothetical protein
MLVLTGNSTAEVIPRPDGRVLRVHLCARSRHQLNILRHRSPKRVVLGKIDRVFCGLYRPLVSHSAEFVYAAISAQDAQWQPLFDGL